MMWRPGTVVYDDDGSFVTITVHPLKENKRPVGFAPWPEEKKEKKRNGKGKKKKR